MLKTFLFVACIANVLLADSTEEIKCNQNEVFDLCPAPCPPRRCGIDPALVLCAPSPTIGDPGCEPGCRCIDGYVRNDTDVCIPKEECPSICGPDEVYSDCTNGGCNAKNCTQLGRPVPCVKINSKNCKKGCICKEGYLRDENGLCVPEQSCPQSCNKPNEVYERCTFDCPPQTCDSLDKAYECPLQNNQTCVGKCKCKPGYYRNLIGECISEEDCRRCPGKHEYYSCGGACDNICDKLSEENQTSCSIVNIKCNEMCYCEEGYARNKNNICVPFDQCNEIQCNKNEVFDLCPAPCPPRRCGIDPATVNCIPSPKIGDPGCEPGCRCIDGYVRNDTDACIPKEECPSICGPDEVYSHCTNGGCNAKNCTQLGRPVPCVKINPKNCRKGCICKEGYLRDENGLCVPEQSCHQSCNKPNEVYNRCTFDCTPQTCDSLDKAYACPLQNNQTCVGKCKCKPGYYRNLIGECISEEDCRRCPGKHEYYSCGGACDNICDKLSEENQTSCSIINIKCNEMCYCEEGYARNKNNICVPFDQCNDPVCPENERHDKCPAFLCGPQKCSELGFGTNCPASVNNGTCPGKPGCVCVNGYVRNNKNVCIPQDQCPSCGGDENAQPGCGNYCGNRCSDYEGGPKICPLICILNSCDCRPGYVYDDLVKKCVLPKDCSSKPLCGENEESSDCANRYDSPDCYVDPKDCIQGCICKVGYVRNDEGVCVRDDCDDSCNGDPNAVVGCGVNCNRHCYDIGKESQGCIEICYEDGCDCKDGYYYDDNINKCVLPEDCTKTCGRNEVYSNCTQAQCGPKNCSQLGYPVACPMIQASSCTQGCLCKKGYLRAENGTCIPGEKCPSCGGDNNARSGCGVNCNKRCGDIGKEPGACIAICYDNACDCNEGFYLNENTGKCVKPNQCPPTCGKDEVYNDCIQGYCQPKNCSEIGKPVACPRIDPKNCIKGCLCKENYVRADNGTCIPKTDCPSCGGDNNARSGCGVNCNKRCSDIGKEPGACILICYDNACDCKDGFYLNENTGKCVKPNQCPLSCGINEVYNSCVQGQCRPKSCSQLGKPLSCPRIDPKYCKGGCLCEDGYVKAKNGTCIPEKECPSCGGDPNAEAGCGINCNRRCSDVGKDPGVCEDDICAVNGCDCKQGYYYDYVSSKCVLPDRCPTSNSPGNVDQSLEKLRTGNMALVGQFLWELYKMDPGQSFVTSPVSVLIPYGQLALYAVRETLDQLLKFINLDNKDQIKEPFPALLTNYRSQSSVLLTVAVKCYGNINYPFTDQFKNDAVTYFDSEGENIDFKYAKQAADTINGWVANKTNNLIQNLVSEDLFSDDTRLVLVNAIYFLGNWQNQFNPNNTRDRDFYITPNKTKSIKTMYQENTFNYGENEILDAQILELFYKGGNSSLVILLPKKKDGLLQMLDKLRNSDELSNSIKSLRREKVKVFLPKMDIETKIDIAELSQKLNVTKMFDPRSDDFEGILLNSDPVYVSAAIQKAKIIVDETGTEAAAATAVVGARATSAIIPENEYYFIADRSYVFCVLLERDPLFCGVFNGN